MNVSSLSTGAYGYDPTITDRVQSGSASASSSLELQSSAAPPPPPPSGNGQGGDPMSSALSSLESALSSGDTNTAQSLVSDILSHSPNASSDSDSDSDTDSTSTTSTTATDSSSPASKIDAYLKSMKESLASGDTSDAQKTLQSLKDYLTANLPSAPSGAGTYSAAGGFQQSSGKGAVSALTALA